MKNDKVIGEGYGKALLKENNNAQVKEKLKREENEEGMQKGREMERQDKEGKGSTGKKRRWRKKQLER